MTSTIPNPETWEKVCTKCGVRKKLKDYHKDKRRSDGRKSWCKPCTSKWREEWYKGKRQRDIEDEKLKRRARQMAYRRLARLEPDKFWILFRQELYKAGFDSGDIEKVVKDSESGEKRVTRQ